VTVPDELLLMENFKTIDDIVTIIENLKGSEVAAENEVV
jgi:acyl carrier protein